MRRNRKLPPGEIIPLRFDYVFAGIFNDENNIDIVELFVSQYLNIPLEQVIGNVKIMNRDLPINNKSNRSKQVDLLLNYNDELINIEINNYDMSLGTVDRNIVLAAHTHGTQLKYGDNDYSHINRTIQINFNKKYHNEENIVDKYFLTNTNGKVLSKKLEIDMIDIDKGMELWYSKSDDVICTWCGLLDTNKKKLLTSLMGSECMQSMPEETKNKLVDEIDKYSEDNEAIFLYNISSKEECARNSYLREERIKAREEGHAEGHAEGLAEGVLQTRNQDAVNFYKNGVSKDIICKSLNMTEEELIDLLKNSK